MKPTEIFATIMLITVAVGGDIAYANRIKASDVPQVTPQAIVEATLVPEKPLTKFITVKVSHYWPDLGGVNCLTFKDGHCVSRMANGKSWESGVGVSIACPPELKMGTRIRILDRIWTCADRGSKITMVDGKYWVDMLTPKAFVPYGKELEAELYLD